MSLTGRAFITVPGFGRLESEAGATLDIGGFTRTTQVMDTGIAGVTETPAASKISCSIQHRSGLSLTQLGALKDIKVDFETDSGGLWVCPLSSLINTVTLSNGKIPLEFEGKPADEIKA